jgi:hypothetical protein
MRKCNIAPHASRHHGLPPTHSNMTVNEVLLMTNLRSVHQEEAVTGDRKHNKMKRVLPQTDKTI